VPAAVDGTMSLIVRDGYSCAHAGDMARAVFERVGKTAPVQVVGGLSIAQAKKLARAGVRAFVISGNLGLPDTTARYDLPPAQIERHVAAFVAEVSAETQSR